MSRFNEITAKVSRLLGMLTDWLLILAGGLLIFKAWVAVDVHIARYVITVLGAMFIGFGLWYRHRRVQRLRMHNKER